MNTSSAAAFNDRLIELEPKLRRIAAAICRTSGSAELDPDDYLQTIHLKLLERSAQDPTFASRSDAEILTFAQWRGRHKASLGRIYNKYIGEEEYLGGDDGDEISSFDLIAADSETPEEIFIEKQDLDVLQAAIQSLPPRQREFALLMYQGYSSKEASDQMGISKVTGHQMKVAVASRLSRLRS
jgi:RNA polymerase sigma factor (sigma-70 family)